MIDLDENEHIIFQIRKHWFVFAAEMTSLIILAIVPMFVFLTIATSGVQIDLSTTAGNTVNLTALAIFLYGWWLLILWIIGYVFWTSYFLDVWVMTNKKLLDIEQRGLFSREVSILHLDKIQDVTSEVHGVFATLVNYGDIHVQTAGQQREFIINGVPNPDEVRKRLNDSLMRYKELNQEYHQE